MERELQLLHRRAVPPDLVKAHAHVDALVNKAYGLSPSCTDLGRVAHLFKLYAETTAEYDMQNREDRVVPFAKADYYRCRANWKSKTRKMLS